MKVGIKRPEQTSGIDFTKKEPRKQNAMKKKTSQMTFVPLIIGFKLNLYLLFVKFSDDESVQRLLSSKQLSSS